MDELLVDRPRWGRRVVLAVCAVAIVAVTGTGYRRVRLSPPAAEVGAPATEAAGATGELQKEIATLKRRVERAAHRSAYIVIDRSNNRLYLRDARSVKIAAICSAGSGQLLRDPSRDREWVFATPVGRFRVIGRAEDPVWRKPDWAFIEENEPIPSDPGDRIEYGTLGEFALHFGNGYMIHGTLYERLLGRNVSHGCIRLGRDDLRALYSASPVGTPIFVF